MPTREAYRSLLALIIGLVMAALVFRTEWLLYSTAVIGLPAVASPWLARRLASGLGWLHEQAASLVNLLGLVVVYLGVLLPLSLIYRYLARRRSADTHYVIRNHTYSAADLRRFW